MGIKLNKKQKKYLRDNYCRLSDASLAKELNISEELISRALKQLQLKRTKEGLEILSKGNSRQKLREKRNDQDKTLFLKKVITYSLLIVVPLSAALIIFLSKPKFIFNGKKYILSPDLNILFITLDTTRADHLGCYGYDKVETPNIDRLAKEGILFKNATCQVPLTLPSHVSIFTGTYPFFHGVRDNGGFYLEPENITLAEVLKEHGWTTSAFIGAFVLDSSWGLNQGFDYYYDSFDFAKYKEVSLDSVQRKGGEVIGAFFDWFEKNYQKKFFSWIHLYDPHTPYDPPEPYKTQYSDRFWGLYDGEIAYVDFLVGKVIETLKKKELLEKTVIVIVGDHGESLGEHEESSHGFFIYDAALSIPLIIRIPSSKPNGIEVPYQVESVAIMPTILDMLDLPTPGQVQGKSLLPMIAGKNPKEELFAYSESYYPRYRYGWSELKSLRSIRYKYIQAPQPELYELAIDPGEQNNVFKENLNLAKKFEQRLKSIQNELSAKGIETKVPQKPDDDAMEKLMALGYVGGFTSSSKIQKTENLPDPKDKILLYNRIKIAEEKFAADERDKSLEEINSVIKEDPKIMEALQVRSCIFLKQNKIEEAISDSKEALRLDPEYEAAIFNLAFAYKLQKKYDESISGYNRIIQLDPKNYKPYLNLGEIYIEMKDMDRAISFLKRSIELDPRRTAIAHNMLGVIYYEKKLFNKAEEEIRKALEMNPRILNGHYNLALIYEEKGEYDLAFKEYQKEIEIFKGSYNAHFNIGKLYGKAGNLDKQIEHFKEAIKYKIDFANGYIFLAKAYLDSNHNFDEAIALAKKALELAPESEYAPLAHYVLADIYSRKGEMDRYKEELRKGQELQQKLKNAGRT